jgi:hypothetical protein
MTIDLTSLFSVIILIPPFLLVIYLVQSLKSAKENYKGKLILLYIFLKSFIVLILIYLVPIIFSRGYFLYVDLPAYTSCNPNSPNSFFSIYLCLIDIDNIVSFRAIGTAIIINTFRDLLLIVIVVKNQILRKKSLLFFVVFLALHPYLALYHAKLSTSIFGVLGVVIMYYAIISSRRQSALIDLSLIVLAGMRNALAGIIVAYYIWEIVRQLIGIVKGKEYFDYYFLKNIISLSAVISVVMLSGQYMFNFLSSIKYYSLDAAFFAQYIDTPFILLDSFIAYVLVIFSHLFFLLGFREAAFTEFPHFFIPLDSFVYFHIFIGIILFIAHGTGFFYFLKSHISKDRRYIIFIMALVPTLFTVAHLRYFIPFIPLSMLGLAMLIDKKFLPISKASINKSY